MPDAAANSSRAPPQKSLHQSREAPGSLPQNHQVTLGESLLRLLSLLIWKWGPFSAYC